MGDRYIDVWLRGGRNKGESRRRPSEVVGGWKGGRGAGRRRGVRERKKRQKREGRRKGRLMSACIYLQTQINTDGEPTLRYNTRAERECSYSGTYWSNKTHFKIQCEVSKILLSLLPPLVLASPPALPPPSDPSFFFFVRHLQRRSTPPSTETSLLLRPRLTSDDVLCARAWGGRLMHTRRENNEERARRLIFLGKFLAGGWKSIRRGSMVVADTGPGLWNPHCHRNEVWSVIWFA